MGRVKARTRIGVWSTRHSQLGPRSFTGVQDHSPARDLLFCNWLAAIAGAFCRKTTQLSIARHIPAKLSTNKHLPTKTRLVPSKHGTGRK